MATPTAPPKTPTASHPHPLDRGASPVCSPGVAVDDPVVAPAPADPVGVSASVLLACTTTALVMVV